MPPLTQLYHTAFAMAIFIEVMAIKSIWDNRKTLPIWFITLYIIFGVPAVLTGILLYELRKEKN